MKTKTIATLLATLPVMACSASAPALNSAGATFPAPLYARLFEDNNNINGVKVNYQSVGSGAGVRQFVAGTVAFAASDEPIKDKDRVKVKRGVVQFPTAGGTIAIGYNKPGCDLKITQKQLVQVYLGKITNWNELGCESGTIQVVHRSDGSGTTFAFTSSLKAFSPEWKDVDKSVQWPVGIGAKGNEGVAGTIKQTGNSIGYVSTTFTLQRGIQVAAVENKAGNFVLPTKESGTEALHSVVLNEALAGEEPNPTGENAYPITTLTYILAYSTGNGRDEGRIKDSLNFLLSEGSQNIAGEMGFVPLSPAILLQSRKAVSSISK